MGMSVRVGAATVGGRVWLAPMTGVSDLPFRRTAARLEAAYVATEMVAGAELAKGRPDVVRRAAALTASIRADSGPASRLPFRHSARVSSETFEATRRSFLVKSFAVSRNRSFASPSCSFAASSSSFLACSRNGSPRRLEPVAAPLSLFG